MTGVAGAGGRGRPRSWTRSRTRIGASNIPRGVVHAVKAISRRPGQVLVAYVPGGQEHAFEEFGRSPRDVVAAKYDSEFVGPPL